MVKKLYSIILAAFVISIFCACSEDVTDGAFPRDPANPLDVTINADIDCSSISRAAGVKPAFVEGDVIQVSGTFTLKNQSTLTLYSYMVYDGRNWTTERETAQLKWPVDAVSGSFTAYYIPSLNGPMTSNSPTEVMLESITDDTDPLYGTKDNVAYGYAVDLKFTHLCTRLIFLNARDDNAKDYWLTGVEGLKNAYSFKLNSDNRFEFEFITKAQVGIDGDTKIASPKRDDGEVVFYLAPGNYAGLKLDYSYYRPYLEFEASQDNNLSVLSNLEENISYTIDINRTLGAIDITEDPEWPEPDDDKVTLNTIDDIEEFLKAIHDGNEYYAKDEDGNPSDLVLSADSKGVTLLRNIDFNYLNKDRNIRKIVPTTITFNGNYHYILNSADALFEAVEGSVINLGISSAVVANRPSDESISALTCRNYGAIGGIRIRESQITFTENGTQGRAFDIGAIVGNNSRNGNVFDITIEGAVTVKSDGYTNSQVNVGGIIGQNQGHFSKVSYSNDLSSLTVLNQCSGSGELSTGGLIGYNSGTVENCILTVNVDCSASDASFNDVGGIIGLMNGGLLAESSVAGTVKGGKSHQVQSAGERVYSRSMLGGLCGAVTASTSTSATATIRKCDAFNNVFGSTLITDADVINAGGGAIGGLIQSSGINIIDNSAWGTATDSKYIGGFIGLWASNFQGVNSGNQWPAGTNFYGISINL